MALANDYDVKMVGPRAKKDGKFELVHISGMWIQRHIQTRKQVRIVGNQVTFYAKGKGLES